MCLISESGRRGRRRWRRHRRRACCAAGAAGAARPAAFAPPTCTPAPPPLTDYPGVKYDLVLSSGFLAFANHCGFLQAGASAAGEHSPQPAAVPRAPAHSISPLPPAVEDVGLPINGIMGTSAGALIGSMYAAGYSPREVGAAGRSAAWCWDGCWTGRLAQAPAAAAAGTARTCCWRQPPLQPRVRAWHPPPPLPRTPHHACRSWPSLPRARPSSGCGRTAGRGRGSCPCSHWWMSCTACCRPTSRSCSRVGAPPGGRERMDGAPAALRAAARAVPTRPPAR